MLGKCRVNAEYYGLNTLKNYIENPETPLLMFRDFSFYAQISKSTHYTLLRISFYLIRLTQKVVYACVIESGKFYKHCCRKVVLSCLILGIPRLRHSENFCNLRLIKVMVFAKIPYSLIHDFTSAAVLLKKLYSTLFQSVDI